MSDFERGVEQASAIYKEVIREYVAENAKLREENQHIGLIAYELGRKSVAQENAKLRELVLSMHDELVSCEDNGYVCGGHKFDERVRELGVEVDA